MKSIIILFGFSLCLLSCSNSGSSSNSPGVEAPTGKILGQVPNHDLNLCPDLNGKYSLGANILVVDQKKIGNYFVVKTTSGGQTDTTYIDGNVRQKNNFVEVGYCQVQDSMTSVVQSANSLVQITFTLDQNKNLESVITCQPETDQCKTGTVTWTRVN